MDTNIFIEGNPHPVVVSVRLPREVENFRTLKEVSWGLAGIDSYLKRDWPKLWPQFGFRRYHDLYILRFQIISPPEFQLFVDPAWIAVFIMILANYKGIKGNIREIRKDFLKGISAINGFTEYELSLLDLAVKLSLDKILSSSEQQVLKLAKKFANIRSCLLGDNEVFPKIRVTKIDKKEGGQGIGEQ